jgi:predicted nuclease of predicted toxin-antitoxin system
MTIWVDAQLNPDLAAWLGAWFRVIGKSIREIGLRDSEDDELFQAARRLGVTAILTKDEDFATLVTRFGPPPQIIWLRCGNLSSIETEALLSKKFAGALARIEAGEPLVEITVS